MAIYETDSLTEQSIYGSSRLGIQVGSAQQGYRRLGGKRYELSNHLGNVLAVVTDNIHLNQDSTWAEVINITDYYPFGLAMEGRGYQDTTMYRYGFNGKENDLETGTQNYGFRIYDPKIAKFLSIDPLTSKYPELTPFQFASNTPIQAIDLDGLEAATYQWDVRGMVDIKTISATNHTVGIVADIHGNIAGFYTPSLGVGAGAGFTVAKSLSFFPYAKDVLDIKGFGLNLGGFYANPADPKLLGRGEINLAVNDKGEYNTVGGTISGTFLPGRSYGKGGGVYLEGAYTFMTNPINIKDLVSSSELNLIVDYVNLNKDKVMEIANELYEEVKKMETRKRNDATKTFDIKDRNFYQYEKDVTNISVINKVILKDND